MDDINKFNREMDDIHDLLIWNSFYTWSMDDNDMMVDLGLHLQNRPIVDP
jgi:hypothetical protein